MKRPMTLRASWHDYHSRCIYMLTFSKKDDVSSFGQLMGGVENAHIELSLDGRLLWQQICKFSQIEPAIKVLQYAIMPDHMHLLIFVQQRTEAHLGNIVGLWKALVKDAFGYQPFDEGFNDQILKVSRKLSTIIDYMRTNPYRLAVRRAYPDFFRRVSRLSVFGKEYEAYGNICLLQNPFKSQVVIHRTDTAEMRAKNRAEWLHTAANGGVLVSPFISPAEKQIRKDAEELGASLILIVNRPFAERFKPAAHDFELCTQGRLLIIAPKETVHKELTREKCMEMNHLAQELASEVNLGHVNEKN